MRLALLLVGFAGAVGIRVLAGQPQVSQSAPAGLLFAALLVLFSVLAGGRIFFRWSLVGAGILGGLILCAPPLLRHLDGTALHRPAGSFLAWGAIVTVVAVAEEAFLRGALYAAFEKPAAAIGVSALCFGLLHVPLYGVSALPLDLAVGIWLGVLREVTGSFAAPAVSHTVADLAGWWLR